MPAVARIIRPPATTLCRAVQAAHPGRTDRAAGTGEVGAVLWREALYSSTLTDWRRQREGGTLHALTQAERGPRAAAVKLLTARLADLGCENARLARQLNPAEAIIDLQKNGEPAGRRPPDPQRRRAMTDAVVALDPNRRLTAPVCAVPGVSHLPSD